MTTDTHSTTPSSSLNTTQQGYLVLSVFQNRDLLKVNPQDGRRGMPKGIHTVDLAVS